MKVLKKYNAILYLIIIVSAILGFANVIFSEGAYNLGWRVNSGAVSQEIILSDSITKKCITNSTGLDYFIPTRTNAEWLAFQNFTPIDVLIGECCTDHTDCVGHIDGYTSCNSVDGKYECQIQADGCLDKVIIEPYLDHDYLKCLTSEKDVYWFDTCNLTTFPTDIWKDCYVHTQKTCGNASGCSGNSLIRTCNDNLYDGDCVGSNCTYTSGSDYTDYLDCGVNECCLYLFWGCFPPGICP